MSTKQSWSAIGEEVRDAIQDALKTGDFKNFNEIVTDVASEAVKAVKEQVDQGGIQIQIPVGKVSGENYTERWLREHNERRALHQEQINRKLSVRSSLAPFERKGSVAGTLYRVFGGIGTGVTAIVSTVFLGLGLGLGGGFWLGFGIGASLLAVSIWMTREGRKMKDRLRRAQKYLELAGNNHYANIEDIALHTNQSGKRILKDVKKMLEDGFFPQGHLDRQESCLMLDDKIYEEYLTLEKQRRNQVQDTRTIPDKSAASADKGLSSEVEQLIAEGQSYIRQLRDMNDNIPGECISAKLFRLENLLKEIFDRVREHPEQAPQMKKFMSYYLPTTLKLVAAYEEFDTLSEQGADILEAKAEIEKTMDTINSAFGELLNRLFRDAAFDATTDAQVLQTMLAKEGLTREPELVRR